MKTLSVFFTDYEFIFVEKGRGIKKLKEYGTVKLPDGYIVNGIIEKLDELSTLVEDVIKRTKISTSKVNLLLHEKIVSVKRYPLPSEVKNKDLENYLKTRMNVDLVLPFSDSLMDVKVSEVNGEREAFIFAASERHLNSYVKMLYKAGLKVVKTDIPALAAHRAYSISKYGIQDFENDIMIVNVYHNMLSINIFNKQYPIFSIVSDIPNYESSTHYNDFAQRVQDEIYRMNNYYVWNINKGNETVKKAIIIPMTGDDLLDENLVRIIINNNMTNVGHLVFYNPNDENNLYDVYVKYLLTMSNSLI
ncbi:pilus assembly protein PilM [Mycoplasmatota bacterium zrk1]